MLFVFSTEVLPSHSLLNLAEEVEKAYQPWHVRKESYVLLIYRVIPTQPLPIHNSTDSSFVLRKQNVQPVHGAEVPVALCIR